ncbi:GNAT family N-acetyltransferase [Candidatus Uabimicrobium sp. HlEnr_7]|uniref:GNAT family N-acetyltransferase n=1 Tax=Candidatus Uabimicrobium helgolandensis TaxID=3095367 RepID=UPI00355763C5
MIQYLNLTDEVTLLSLHNLQKKSYKEEAQLIDFYEIPPLLESLRDLQQCQEIFYGYVNSSQLQGAISYKISQNVLDIHRLMVDPQQFRKGIARTLLSFTLQQENFKEVIVSTAIKNVPAIYLYKKMGFVATSQRRLTKELTIQNFKYQKEIDAF